MKLYTLREVSPLVGLGIDGLHRLIHKGKLTVLQPGGEGGKFYVPEDELERLRRRVTEKAK